MHTPPAVAPRPESDGSPPLSVVFQWFLPASLITFFVTRNIILSGKRLMLLDELLTWYPASAPFRAMFSSTADTINASPPFYFVTIWLWAKLFGNTADSLRFFSTLAVAIAIIATFIVLKRAYGALAASVALTVAFFDPQVLSQSLDARFYALMLAEVAVGILLYQTLMRRRHSLGLLALNSFVHASLVMTHYFGPFYSTAILAAVLLTGIFERRMPWRFVLSIVAGWLVFIPWIPVFLRHTQMVRPTFGIPVPTPADLRNFYGHYLTSDVALLAVGLGALALAAGGLAAAGKRESRDSLRRLAVVRRRERSLLVLAPLFALVPLATYFISTRPGGTSTFLERYMTPSALGWAVLCAHVSHRVFSLRSLIDRPIMARVLTAVQIGVVTVFMGWCQWRSLDAARQELPQRPPAGLLVPTSPGQLVVVENVHLFIVLHFYALDAPRYLFAVDRELGINAGGGAPANHLIMATLKRQFPEQFKEVVSSADFLADAANFWVRADRLEWWHLRVEQNPAFDSDYLVPSLHLVHVHRRR